MGLFKKLKDFFYKKKVLDKIKSKHEETSFIKQDKFDEGLDKSSSLLNSYVSSIAKKNTINQDLVDQIEEILISYDVGSAATAKILDAIVNDLKQNNITDGNLIKEVIIDKLLTYYIQDSNVNTELNIVKGKTNVILIAGVNGVGKTTSIAKITNYLLKQKYSVALIAGDTFRAGAVAQLEQWAKRLNVKIYKPKSEGQDPASVIYEGMKECSQEKIDVVLCDTSGRLQTKINLMNELKKINNIIEKFAPGQPCESLLVLDATTGQNGVVQARAFNEVTKLTGIILTKMDSTAKGGIVLAIKDAFNLPIKFIGLGEQIEDLAPFDLEMFVYGLLKHTDFNK